MRNLKRILAMAMAVVMILGMMVIGSSAASYTDVAQIDDNYAVAVEVLSNLGVFKGQSATEAVFAPKAILTRAEAATLIYRVITGDVNDKQTQNYDYASLKDVKAGQWYTGYVTYANNGGYIKGDENGNFNPNAQVTGVQVMAIMLRATGYGQNGEYEGEGWKDYILTDAKELGITGSISTATLDAPASRELVAQLIFNAMSGVDMVSYNMLTGYKSNGETLGEKVFDLAEIEGVVTANEYANLDGAKVLKAGKTVIGDVTYNVSTEITDIGESRIGWAADKDVLYLADSGDNTVWENAGAATDISTSKKFEKVTDLSDYAEDYVNFGTDDKISYETDILITYSKTGLYTDKVMIKAGTSLSQDEYDDIWDIFYDDEYAGGWVVVGTKVSSSGNVQNAENDISDEISFKKFVAEYLDDPDETNLYDVDKVVNGDWLKVIDNDGDGKADYVFQTTFEMRQVTNITKKGYIYLSAFDTCEGYAASADYMPSYLDPEEDTIVADEIAKGDIVLTTYIDGVYYINLADVVTETIDKKGIDSKAETITCGDNVYGKSGIAHDDAMDDDILNADTQVSYDMYLDHFGYVRLYEESAWGKGFVLLTDGYYETDKRNNETYMAEIWNNDEQDYEDVTVVDATKNPADTFIDNDVAYGDKDWDRLLEAEQIYTNVDSEFTTNVAGYSVNEDGEYTLIKIGAKGTVSNQTAYDVVELDLTASSELSDKTLKAGSDTIQATTDTEYYLVVDGDVVASWVGYKNAPTTADLGDTRSAYAVVHDGAVSSYDVADVIVFETDEYDASNLYLVYDYNNYYAIAIGIEDDEYVSDLYVDLDTAKESAAKAKLTADVADYYIITEDGDVLAIDSTAVLGEYADEYIYAGTVVNDDDVSDRDYLKITREGGYKTLYFYEGDAPIFAITKSKTGKISVDELDYEDVQYQDKLVVMTDSKGNILYLVDVSVDDNATGTLWADIVTDAQSAVLGSSIELTVTYGGVTVTAGTTTSLSYAQGQGAEWDVVPQNGTDILKETVSADGLTLTVIAQSEDGKVTDSYTYTVTVAAPSSATTFAWTTEKTFEVDSSVACFTGTYEITVEANWLEAKKMSLADFVDRYAEPENNASEKIVENTNASVTYIITAEDGTTTQSYIFKVAASAAT